MKIGVGRGESGVVVVVIDGSTCAFIMTGCASVGCAAIVSDARAELDVFCIWQTYDTVSVCGYLLKLMSDVAVKRRTTCKEDIDMKIFTKLVSRTMAGCMLSIRTSNLNPL